jgi:hypothetical protein
MGLHKIIYDFIIRIIQDLILASKGVKDIIY